jgi:hypothetical protein
MKIVVWPSTFRLDAGQPAKIVSRFIAIVMVALLDWTAQFEES